MRDTVSECQLPAPFALQSARTSSRFLLTDVWVDLERDASTERLAVDVTASATRAVGAGPITSLTLRFEQEFVDGLLHEIVRSASLLHTNKSTAIDSGFAIP